MDFRLFVDEVGNNDLNGAANDPNVRYLSLTGIFMIRVVHDGAFTDRVNALKGLLPAAAAGGPIILHRREIVRREGVFSALRDHELQVRFNNSLLGCLSESPFLTVTVQIDKKAHLETYGAWHFDPYHYCLRCLVERYVLYLSRHNYRADVVSSPASKARTRS